MATKAVSDDRLASTNESVIRPNAPKSYRPPSLVKGPSLSAVTAADSKVSGVTQDL
jgi:hypothetical protein